MHRRPRLILAAALAATMLSACGSDSVAVSAGPRSADAACGKVAQRWPSTVAGTSVRTVTPDDPTVHAWGDPAIIARCGVAPPGPSTECVSASGVDWVMRDLSDGKAFVTFGRDPAIEVLVPSAYSPEPLVLGAFAEAAAQIPQGPDRCS
ncbi:DUF3515 family protein [Calidifontibacter sp. DB0510]|uniref:DUF3515 family protein n=1 Tax=Metallococcus carri TaxID=1656884 RepID=A0A967AXY4_9MICO|nr:DUF3515 family protein [Metallococcus carri]NHN54474.1 DUF3515 family protein [Metallococcus carri]NOP36687.1 DUF3515 family protein [Calidifontibacter sp. DB2511S]